MESDSTRANSSSNIITTEAVLLVFTKTPVPGRVKTRLLAVMGPEQAAAIAVDLLRRTLDIARRSCVRDIELWCTPATRHPTLVELGKNFSVPLQTQTGANLGERMYSAMEQALANYRHVMLAGSDCIDLAVADLDLAREKLVQGYDVVLGPSLDGGYHLIGLSRLYRELFTGIEWGTDSVLRETRKRVAQLDLKLYELPERRDLDRPEDLDYLGDGINGV